MNDQKRIEVIGIPWDEKSSFMRGCGDAPGKIWDAFNCESANRSTENGHDLGKNKNFIFTGNETLSSGDFVLDEIEAVATKTIDAGISPLFLGGDHAITYPIVKGLSKKYDNLNVLHFDAHPDLYDTINGDKYCHGCPFARIMEGGYAKRLVSVGIRTMNRHQQEQADRFGVEIVEMKDFDSNMVFDFEGPLYLSLDLDVLDPAFVPGISHHEPGGMTTRELIRTIQNFKGQLVGADIVEYNPHRDIQNLTAMVAAKLMKEVGVRFML